MDVVPAFSYLEFLLMPRKTINEPFSVLLRKPAMIVQVLL